MLVPPSLRRPSGALGCVAAALTLAAALPAPAAAVATHATARAATTATVAASRASKRTSKRTSKRASKRARARSVARAGVTLRGSRAAVDRAYLTARTRGVTFARSRREVVRLANAGTYVRLPASTRNYRLAGVAMPYVRPTTRGFLATFAAEYRGACREPLTVTSAMRPTSVHLVNSSARTVHPTGMAVDLRLPRGARCRAWMRDRLLDYEVRGVVDATEERRPAHFHVTVFRAG